MRVKDAIRFLEEKGYRVSPPKRKQPKRHESVYWKAIRTGVYPEIWPPIFMSLDELIHFRSTAIEASN